LYAEIFGGINFTNAVNVKVSMQSLIQDIKFVDKTLPMRAGGKMAKISKYT
jgi:hypothetical protein